MKQKTRRVDDAVRGKGGELHQTSNGDVPILTTQQGTPVSDDQNSLKVGARGPTTLEDFHLREKIFHFDHERIPERVVHARGFGAHGYFENYESLPGITAADLFQRAGEKTPAFVRFSTVAGNKGSADLARDVRGFAVKLYTQQGNWDIVGNNIPVFFIQDAIKFPDLIHAAKAGARPRFPAGADGSRQFLGFHLADAGEHAHDHVGHVGSRDPRSFRFMEGFGVHTFRLVNAARKIHLRQISLEAEARDCSPWCGTKPSRSTAPIPDFHRRDLVERHSIRKLSRSGSSACSSSTMRLPKSSRSMFWTRPRSFPKRKCRSESVGRLVLDRCVDNFFAETEQVAFCTNNIVPGVDFSNDPLLQGRNFSYLDTQVKRLGGPNFTHIPINAPKCPFHNFQQDGHMAMLNPEGRANYEPNSRGGAGRPAGIPKSDSARSGRGKGTQGARSARKVLPTTTARLGSSTSARPKWSRDTSPTRWSSS